MQQPPRQDKLPLDALRRVMPTPKPDPNLPPKDPTLLEMLVDSFYDKPKPDER